MFRNKSIRERQLVKGDADHEFTYNALQQEYMAARRKEDALVERWRVLERELADIEFAITAQKDVYDDVKGEYGQYETQEKSKQE